MPMSIGNEVYKQPQFDVLEPNGCMLVSNERMNEIIRPRLTVNYHHELPTSTSNQVVIARKWTRSVCGAIGN